MLPARQKVNRNQPFRKVAKPVGEGNYLNG